ncbi:unnamed protein product [Camellia sinensis]
MMVLQEENFSIIRHMLEFESHIIFDINHFEVKVFNGNWDDAKGDLSLFCKLEDGDDSKKIFFEIQKQKFFEAFDK